MNLKLIGIIAVIAIYVGSITGAYFKGRSDESSSVVTETLTDYQKGVEENATIDKTIKRKSIPALDDALRNWVQPDYTE